MKAGLFMMPSHPPERELYAAHQWDLECIELAERQGMNEVWIGEHFTAPWEPIPAPDILIAQALMRTDRIMLGAGAHLLPFHNPVELAARVAYLDHLAQGRFMFGIGAGGLPTDHTLFDVDMKAGEHREMTREALDIILKVWQPDKDWEYRGKFWNFNTPDPTEYEAANLRAFLTPFQKPHPPIGVAAASPSSETLKIAGERGYIPMSLGLNARYVASHWEAMMEGAQRAGKPPPSRSHWRIVRDMWVDETDEKARESAMSGMLGRAWREYILALYQIGPQPLARSLKHDDSIPDEAVTVDYCLNNVWLIGSPDTVAGQIRDLYEMVGGFGTLLWLTYDHSEDMETYERAVRLFSEEVLPQVSDLTGD